jgi:hypothetical protein
MKILVDGRLIETKAAPEYQHKAFAPAPAQLKLTDAGEVTVAFAQLNVVDKDGDLTLPGAFPSKSVPMSAYGHTSWMGELPPGKGQIREEAGWAIFDGKFFLDTDQGRNAYQTVKNMADLQEWSYGYLPTDYAYETRDGAQIRILKTLDVFEVSPVLVGAGNGTHTRAIKTADLGSGQSYADHLSLGLETVKAIVARSKDRAEFRAKEGRTLSSANRARLTTLASALGQTLDELRGLLDETDPDATAAAALQVSALLEEARFLGVQI